MSNAVLPEPAGASTMKERWMSRASRRASASGGSGGPANAGANCESSGESKGRVGNGRTSATVCLRLRERIGVGVGIGIFEDAGVERGSVETAEQALLAMVAGLGVAFGRDPRIAGVEVAGERFQHFAPRVHLGFQARGLQLGCPGQDSLVRFVAVETHLPAGANVGEGDGGKMGRVGDNGVERQLLLLGTVAKPVGGLGLA